MPFMEKIFMNTKTYLSALIWERVIQYILLMAKLQLNVSSQFLFTRTVAVENVSRFWALIFSIKVIARPDTTECCNMVLRR